MSDPATNIPAQFREEADKFPPPLRAVLEAELAAGNQIVTQGCNHPASRFGAYFIMANPFTARARETGGGLKFYDYNGSTYSGSFTDSRGEYVLLEPPCPQEPIDMDAIREAHSAAWKPRSTVITSDPNTVLGKFERSMVMDYMKSHDGDGYDIGVLEGATPGDRQAVEALVLSHGIHDWRDVEALAALGTPGAIDALKKCIEHRDSKISMAVTRYAPELVPDTRRIATIVAAIERAGLQSGLSEALDDAADFHPKEVVEALFRAALAREGECAVHFAALLMYVHGKADAPFDWGQRPFFLRFHTPRVLERRAVFVELCEKIAVDPAPYLGGRL